MGIPLQGNKSWFLLLQQHHQPRRWSSRRPQSCRPQACLCGSDGASRALKNALKMTGEENAQELYLPASHSLMPTKPNWQKWGYKSWGACADYLVPQDMGAWQCN